jgi:hypothetical protein
VISAFKRKIALALALVFLLQVFGSVFIYADFIINNEYIATVLCINKKKPEMHCDGKCYLKMQLGKEEEKKQSQENILKENNKVQFVYEPYSSGLTIEIALAIDTEASFYYHQISSQELAFAIFHPPQV